MSQTSLTVIGTGRPIKTTSAFDWVPREELEKWLYTYYPAMLDKRTRQAYVHAVDQRFVSPMGDGRGRFESTFRVMRFDGTEFEKFRFRNLANKSGKDFEDVFEEARIRARASDDAEGALLINIARFHVLHVVSALLCVDGYEPRYHSWRRNPQYHPYVRRYAGAYFKSLLGDIYAARRGPSNYLRACGNLYRRIKRTLTCASCRDATGEPRGCSTVIPESVAVTQSPILRVNEKGELDYEPNGDVAGRYDQAWVGVTPCFRVVNSSVKSVSGYAKIQIGGAIDGKDDTVYIRENTVAELVMDLKRHADKLRARGVHHVLLSGTIYGPNSKLSPHILNAVLPKCFDGMSVKLVGNAKYSRKVATRVREYIAEPEYAECDEDDEYVDYGAVLEEATKPYDSDAFEAIFGIEMTEQVVEEPDLVLLQTVYNEAFSNSVQIDQYQKQLEFHLTPFDTPMPEINMRADVAEFCDVKVLDPPRYLEPVLRTHLEYRHPINQQELLYSVFNRNYCPPKDNALVSSIEAATELFEAFKSVLKDVPTPINVADKDISAYIDKKGEVMAQELVRLLDEPMEAPERWNALVKGAAKPALTDGNNDVMSPTQVIVFKDKLYNALLGPALGKVKDQILKLISDDIFVYSDAAGTELDAKLTRNMDKILDKDVNEADIGRYDKSQGFTSFFFEIMVFRYFGVPPALLWLWIDSHWFAHVKSMTGTASFQLPPQRKSGDPWTYSGNTLYLIAILARLYKGKYTYMMVSGDDSLIFGRFSPDFAGYVCDVMARDYNLDVKMVKADSLYFCSRFLLCIRGRLFLIPDPLKFLIKLSKKDVRDLGHLEDIRISLCDQIALFKYMEIQMEMERVIGDRYDIILTGLIMQHMYALVHDKAAFRAAFLTTEYSEKLAIVCPTETLVAKSRYYVVHGDLIRRVGRYKRMDDLQKAAYMRSIASNAGRRILITDSEEFVPQGVRIVARLQKCNLDVIRDIVKTHYKA